MIDSNVLVTIAIPVYNALPYLRDTIQSVINQTYTDWILYLINDGSTDGSLAVMKEYALRDNRVFIVDDGKNQGLIYRLNQSTSMCKTKYYTRMDADDIMAISRIKDQVEYLEAHPEIDVLGASIMTIDNKNHIVGSGLSEGIVNGFIHPTVMGRTEWFKSNPYANWALRAEDFELWIRTSAYSRFYAIGKPLLFYREYGVPTFKKYYMSQCTILRIVYQYKNYSKPFSWFIINTIKVYCKIFIYAIFASVGKLDYLISRRKRKPLPDEMWLTEEDLKQAIKYTF